MFTVWENNKHKRGAALGMFKGLCDYIRERGGLDNIGDPAKQLYYYMQKRIKNIHGVNVYYSDDKDIDNLAQSLGGRVV